MKQRSAQLAILLIPALFIGIFFAFDLQHYFTLSQLQSRYAYYLHYYQQQPLLTLVLFFLIYLLLTSLSIPCLSIVILVGASLFGFSTTLLVISFADVFGSTVAFLGSRYLIGKHFQQKNSSRLRAINQGIARDGSFYLLYLRLTPIFPCFLINLLMGLTKMRVSTFYWATQLGKFPHNALYANAGTQLGKLDSVLGFFSPTTIVSLSLIGCFPLIVRYGMQRIKGRKHILLQEQHNV